jgi:hypothetical protein
VAKGAVNGGDGGSGMKGLIIYEPRGPAGETSARALNIYRGCDHRCEYCYVAGLQHVPREQLATVSGGVAGEEK